MDRQLRLDTKRLFDISAIPGAKAVKKKIFREGSPKILYSWIVISWNNPPNRCARQSPQARTICSSKLRTGD